ncbi:type-F conjugative transfer system secretin TraK [Acinetobacter seifertii]|uniref:type-F conjugative transfer system secretin TraK n=1 Tax=Acinetobacter calcoaceticus/baumannii complex TaxID=909768 RepID=UPI000C21E16C|nr:type-F conjugative transfer system secretin TraK [Acinetobacter seifertii]PJG65519.1 conjugal transfer protein TraK [Acinetobacter seifertii]
MKLQLNKIALLISSILLTTTSFAAQHITKADQETVQVTVSNTEPNVLVVDGRRIVNLVPSDVTALDTLPDKEQGTLYFKVSQFFQNTPVTLFVTDDEGTRYKLVLQPRSVGAEEIVLVPPKPGTGTSKRSQSYLQQIKELMYVMGDDAENPQETLAVDGISRSFVKAEIPLWKESKFVLLRRYDTDGMYGEMYQLTNLTNKTMNLLEQEFYRKGVSAVSIQNLSLSPGRSTFVYVVRENN